MKKMSIGAMLELKVERAFNRTKNSDLIRRLDIVHKSAIKKNRTALIVDCLNSAMISLIILILFV